MAPGISLPARTTRGKRLRAVVDEEEQGADEDFWNQEFFAEEQQDIDYEQEDEEEDVPDSDFDISEGDDDDDEVQEEKERPRKKALKPPGAPSSRPAKPKAPAPAANDDENNEKPAKAAKAVAALQLPPEMYEAPTLRRSTVARVTEAERERLQKQDKKPRRRANKDDSWRPLTQQELLAEAARTEMENMYSLKLLLAMEEETKRKAAVVKQKHTCPLVKYHSKKVGDEELTLFEVCNMHYPPPWLRRQRAPLPAVKPICAATGLPAKYRDPATGQPFSSPAAYAHLHNRPSVAPSPPATSPYPGGARDPSAALLAAAELKREAAKVEAVEAAAAAAQRPFELPPALMALVVDLHGKMNQRPA